MKKVILMLLTTVFVITLVGCNLMPKENNIASNITLENEYKETYKNTIKMHGDYQHYGSIDTLTEACDLIIVGEVVNVHSPKPLNLSLDKNDPFYVVSTIAEIKVEKTIKGKPTEEIVQVYQKGGIYEDTFVYEEGVEYLEKGTRGIFFLLEPSELMEDFPYIFINPREGYVKLIDDKIVHNKHIVKEKYLFTENSSEGKAIKQLISITKNNQ